VERATRPRRLPSGSDAPGAQGASRAHVGREENRRHCDLRGSATARRQPTPKRGARLHAPRLPEGGLVRRPLSNPAQTKRSLGTRQTDRIFSITTSPPTRQSSSVSLIPGAIFSVLLKEGDPGGHSRAEERGCRRLSSLRGFSRSRRRIRMERSLRKVRFCAVNREGSSWGWWAPRTSATSWGSMTRCRVCRCAVKTGSQFAPAGSHRVLVAEKQWVREGPWVPARHPAPPLPTLAQMRSFAV